MSLLNILEELTFAGSYQGMALQAAEKVALPTDSYQGMTSVMPLALYFREGVSPSAKDVMEASPAL